MNGPVPLITMNALAQAKIVTPMARKTSGPIVVSREVGFGVVVVTVSG
jgi:hypothetical protein